jgi:hypothetical protein
MGHLTHQEAPWLDHRVSDDGHRAMVTVTGHDADDVVAAALGASGDSGALALVFASSADRLGAAGAALLRHDRQLEVVGCTSAGLIDRSGQVGAGLQITIIGGDGLACATAVAPLTDDSRDSGRLVGQAVGRLPAPADPATDHRALILLVDGLAGDTNDVVRGAYEQAGASVPIVGGCAGDDLATAATHQLLGDEVVTGSVVAVAIRSTAPLGIGVRHGWLPTGTAMTVTETEGTSILTLDDRPALDLYLEALRAPTEWTDEAAFASFCQIRPLGLESRGGHHVRFIRGADLDRRSIEFLVAVPEGELVTFMEGDTDSVIAAAGSAIEDAVAQLTGPALGIIAFDCVACRGVIGDERLGSELEQVVRHLPADAAVGGFYTYGEIARRGGNLGFHNQTMVALALQ